jgi:chromosome segregation ATPase
MGVAFLTALPAGAADPAAGSSAAELERAIARIREQVETQRAATSSAAGDMAERSAELDRLAVHLAALERDNHDLQARNAQLAQALDEAMRRGAQLEREKEALAKLTSARLAELPDAVQRLAAVRGEIETVARLLEGLTDGRADASATARDEPLPRLEAPGAAGGPAARAARKAQER